MIECVAIIWPCVRCEEEKWSGKLIEVNKSWIANHNWAHHEKLKIGEVSEFSIKYIDKTTGSFAEIIISRRRSNIFEENRLDKDSED